MPRAVLDASAVLAVILEEPGAELVVEALRPSLTPPGYESWYCVDRSIHYGRARGYPCD